MYTHTHIHTQTHTHTYTHTQHTHTTHRDRYSVHLVHWYMETLDSLQNTVCLSLLYSYLVTVLVVSCAEHKEKIIRK